MCDRVRGCQQVRSDTRGSLTVAYVLGLLMLPRAGHSHESSGQAVMGLNERSFASGVEHRNVLLRRARSMAA